MSAPDLLFELGTEELPPRTLKGLSAALTDGVLKGLDGAGIAHGTAHGFATPRRLAVLVRSCAERAADRRVERRGPPVSISFDATGAPTQAAAAFARNCEVPLAELERLVTEKGEWLVYRGTEYGAATAGLLGGIINDAIAALPIAKRMRWGARTAEFVRPVHSVVLLHGSEVIRSKSWGSSPATSRSATAFTRPAPFRSSRPGRTKPGCAAPRCWRTSTRAGR